jgi:hypothetical protein
VGARATSSERPQPASEQQISPQAAYVERAVIGKPRFGAKYSPNLAPRAIAKKYLVHVRRPWAAEVPQMHDGRGGTAPPAGAPLRVAAARLESRPVSARIDNVFHRNSAWFFLAFLALAVWAFWPSYFARLFDQPSLRFHAHGIALTLWCVLLVVQPQLLRTGRRALHRQLGKTSYVLAPALIVITASFVHYRIGGGGAVTVVQALPSSVLFSVALMLNSLVAFAALYGLAIYYRRNASAHGRYMLCTVFPLFTPVTDRLIGAHLPALVRVVPRIDGSPVLPVVGFLLADAILLALAVWDWRTNHRKVFLVALGVLVAYHASTLTLHRVPLWNAFCAWFLSLPLS